jgi:mannose-1-phosphate guanylyltransferase
VSVPRQAVVLCAGEGRRLRPHTLTCPKPLLPLANVPILEHLLHGLRRAGVRRVALNAWHLAAQVRDWAARREPDGLELYVRIETVLLGTAGGLANLRDWMEPGPLLVLTGDVAGAFDYKALGRRHRASGAEATMLLCPHADTAHYGAVNHDDAGRMTDVAGLRGVGGEHAAVNASVHVLEPAFLDRLPRGPACLARQGYVPALADGARCAIALHAGPWADLGTPADLLAAQAAALAGRLPVAPELLARGGQRHGARNLVHPTARVAPDAELDGGTVVGPRVAIGRGTRLRGCLVLAGAVVPAGADLEAAVIDPSVGQPAAPVP